MIDIETLGTAANSVVLSIGAVRFDDTGLLEEFYCVLNTASCISHGLAVEERTVQWWDEQGEAARKVIEESRQGGLALPIALNALASSFDWENTRVWCNGLNFDLPILDTAYRACGMSAPWAYYNGRDFRTIKNEFARETVNLLAVEPAVAHHALADAKAQALTLLALRDFQRSGPRGVVLAA
jgi:hypothetical protein